MKLYSVTFEQDRLLDVLRTLKEKDYDAIEGRRMIFNSNVTLFDQDNPYTDMYNDIRNLMDDLSLKDYTSSYEMESFDDASKYLEEVKKQYELLCNTRNEIVRENDENVEALHYLHYIHEEDLNLDDLKELKLLRYHFGKITKDNYKKLEYIKEARFLMDVLDEDDTFVYVLVLYLPDDALEVENILLSILFSEIEIDTFVHGTVTGAIDELTSQSNTMTAYVHVLDERIENLKVNAKNRLENLYHHVKYMKEAYDDTKYVVKAGDKYQVHFFTDDDQDVVSRLFSYARVLQLPEDIYKEQGIEAPKPKKSGVLGLFKKRRNK